MKLPSQVFYRSRQQPLLGVSSRRRTQGSALFVILLVLAIMTVLLTANGRVVWLLREEIRIVEKQQIKRWSAKQTESPQTAQAARTPVRR